MQIQIVNVEISTKPTAKGSYQVADVAYKNLTNGGKIEGKKIMSFTNKDVFGEIAGSKSGDVYDVTTTKDDKGYWQWSEVKKSVAGAAQPAARAAATAGATSATTIKSTYETPEERAKKQVYIIRQSSISSAIDLLSVGAKASPKLDEVIATAKVFEGYVFGVDQKPVEDSMLLPTEGDPNDDIPF